MMRPEYIEAIETRLKWAQKMDEPAIRADWMKDEDAMVSGLPTRKAHPGQNHRTYGGYRRVLTQGELYVMAPQFCGLVEQATESIPETVRFDATWLQSAHGWLYLSVPFLLPAVEEARQYFKEGEPVPVLRIRAIGWERIPDGPMQGHWQILVFGDHGWPDGTQLARSFDIDGVYPAGFFPLSYLTLRDGDELGTRMETFEHVANDPARTFHPGHYVEGPEKWRHELRWMYAALHLMAQKLTTHAQVAVDRGTRRRAQRTKQITPPFVTVITLRRLEADRNRDPKGNDVDWQWQWTVVGHWRHQWYPSEGIHRDKFIEAFVKGPPDKPMKPPGIKLFVAKR